MAPMKYDPAQEAQRARMRRQIADPNPPKVGVPIDFSGSGTALVVKDLILQMIAFIGVAITMFGLGEQSWIVKTYKLAIADESRPIIAAVAAVAAIGYQQFKRVRNLRKAQTLTLLPTVPDTVAIGPANPPPAVVAAVQAATVVIDQQAAAPVPAGSSGGM